MAKVHFKVSIKKDLTNAVKKRVDTSTDKAIRHIAKDYARTTSGATPHKTGLLGGSYAINYKMSSTKKQATIEYAVYNGNFNYAIAMHEWNYKLGEGSRAKGGGTGMSGKTYKVGRKFMTRVLKGESKAYRDYIGQQVQKAVE